MAAGFNINPMNMFRQNPQNNQPNPANNDPNNPQTPSNNSTTTSGMPNNQNPNADPNNSNPNNPQNNQNNPNNQPGSPLDAFKDLFKVDPNKPQPKDPFSEPLFNLDPKKLSEAATKMDFTRNLNPELVNKALQGDQQAFSQVLNQVMQSSFMMSTQMLVGMMEGGVRKNNERYNSVLDGRFREFTINSSEPQNPALRHEAAKPVLAALRAQIAQANPNLSPSEVSKQAEDYFLSMSKAISSFGPDGKPVDATRNQDPNAPKEPDYSAFLQL